MIELHRNDTAVAFPIPAGTAEIALHVSSAAEVAMSKGRDTVLGMVAWLLAAFIAYIFVYYLQFKFTGHQGSVDLFTTLTDWLGFHGHEKFMRIGTGTMELIASVLLFGCTVRLSLHRLDDGSMELNAAIRLFALTTQVVGAALALGIMTGAIFFHLASPLGIDPYGDGGVLFKEACAVWLSSLAILAIRRRQAVGLVERYFPFLPIPSQLRQG
jgi:hypothetical protein